MKRRLPLKVAQHIIIHSLKDEKFSLRMKVISFFSLPFHALECVSVLFSLSIPLSIHGLVVVIHVTDNDEGIPSKRISWWRWFSAKEWEWEREVSSTRKTLSRVYIHVSCIYLCVCSVFFQMLTWLLWNCIHVHKVCVRVCFTFRHSLAQFRTIQVHIRRVIWPFWGMGDMFEESVYILFVALRT